MGLFKDMRKLKKQAEAMQPPEHRGLPGGMRAMRDSVAQGNELLADMAKASELMTNGRPGTATITTLRDTGTTVNDNPVVELDLQVSVGAGAPYPVMHRQAISRLAVAGFQPGATVPVHVDVANPQSLVVG